MFCKNCGVQLKKGSKFCSNCGKQNFVKTSNKNAYKNISSRSYFLHSDNLKLLIVKNKQALFIIVVILVIIFISVLVKNNSKANSTSNVTANINNSQSVVGIYCNNNKGGSGVIFTTSGVIITNNHVITGASSCQVTIPNTANGEISEIYDAKPIITPTLSAKYDVATLKIDGQYTDSKGKTYGPYPVKFTPFTLPSSCDTSTPSQLGDSVRIYGYPVTSGGYNLTVTDGIISSFSDSGYILTSAKVDSGNSGGLAVDKNGCWLGIPSAVISGNYQNLGVIIPGIVVQNILSSVPYKKEPVVATIGDNISTNIPTSPSESDTQICQNTYGSNSEYAGHSDSKGNPYCKCQGGYVWNTNGTACVLETNDQKCQANYGLFSQWTGEYNNQGGLTCGCMNGFTWNNNNTECVLRPSCPANSIYNQSMQQCECMSGYIPVGNTCESPYTYCQNSEGYGATYDPTNNSCTCLSGYTYSGGQCITDNQYCWDLEGYNSTYDPTTNSCTCDSGFMYIGSQCVDGSTYCFDKYGFGAEFDYATNNCACQPGYISTGSSCVLNY